LAVLRIGRVRKPPPPIAIGTSRDLKVGQAAYAIGNPFGLDQTLTTGVISALQRRLPTGEGTRTCGRHPNRRRDQPWQFGRPAPGLGRPGDRGEHRDLFPVRHFGRDRVRDSRRCREPRRPELIRNGRMPQPGIGIIAGAEAASARLGVPGVVVMRTLPGSPAARSGLRGSTREPGAIGDVIVSANGRPVTRLADLLDEVRRQASAALCRSRSCAGAGQSA
jgi:2-alkenal reductase